jgi:hypothetical protein
MIAMELSRVEMEGLERIFSLPSFSRAVSWAEIRLYPRSS